MEKRLCTKLGIALIIVGSVFLLTVAAVLAASSSGLELSPLVGANSGPSAAPLLDEEPPDEDDDVDGRPSMTGSLMIANAIFTYFTEIITPPLDISVTEVISLRTGVYTDTTDYIFGWGEIAKVYWMAYKSGISVDQLVISRTQEGMGWGQIAKAVLGSAGNKGDNLGKIMRTAKKNTNGEPTQEAAQTTTTSSHGQGNAYGHSKQGDQAHGNQGQGNPHNGDNPGRGHDKGQGKGKGKDK